MPFGNTSNISALNLRGFFGPDNSVPFNISNYYRGLYNSTAGTELIPNVSENSGFPTSGAVSFGNFSGKYRGRVETFLMTASAGGASNGVIGFNNYNLSFGSLSPTQYISSNGVFTVVELDYYSNPTPSQRFIYLTLRSTAGNYANNNLKLFRAKFSVNGGSTITFTSSNISGQFANNTEFSMQYSNTAFTSGNTYIMSIEWIN